MLSTQNKSFFLLLFLTVGSLYTALILTREINPLIGQIPGAAKKDNNGVPQVKADAVVNIADWKTYTDTTYPLSFKYPADWTITTYKSPQQAIGYIIILEPVFPNADHIRIYINNKGYVAIDGLKTTKTAINEIPAVTVNDMLYGIRQNGNFITFDLGVTMELLPYFKALLSTVELTK